MQQSFVQDCAAVQVSYCAQLTAAPDLKLKCQQQQQAKDSCRRSCGLCYDKVDSSSLVWYNQAKSLGSTLAPTPTPTPGPTFTPTSTSTPASSQAEPQGISPNLTHTHNQVQASSGLQGVMTDAGAHQLNDQPDPLVDPLADPLADKLRWPAYNQAQADNLPTDDVADAIGSQQVESVADSVLMQPASAGLVSDGKMANLTPSTTHESPVDIAAGPITAETHANIIAKLANSSGGSNLLGAAGFSAIPESHLQEQNVSTHMHVAPTHQDSWQNHLSNPFCKSVLCLCALLLTCILCLLRRKLKRRKVLR